MVASLKASLKEKTQERDAFKIQLEGVSHFIDVADIGNISSYRERRNEIEKKLAELKDKLLLVKMHNTEENDATKELRNKIVQMKNEIRVLTEQKLDQDEYITKLRLL